MSKSMNNMLRKLEREFSGVKKKENNFPVNPETGLPEPKNFKELLAVVNDVVQQNRSLYQLAKQLELALPQQDEKKEPLDPEQFKAKFLTGREFEDTYRMVFAVNPIGIALVSLEEYFKGERFKIVDPASLEYHADLETPYAKDKITHTTYEIGGKPVTVPVNGEFWFEDTAQENKRFIVSYQPAQGGQVQVAVYTSYPNSDENSKLSNEIKMAVLQSPMIRGQVIEISEGSGFNVVDLGEQPFPIISEELKDELEKNVISLFDKTEEFRALGQAVSRKIILSGPPGCGKTMIERYLASRVRGKVTTIWVSAKSIEEREHIDEIFEIARKLSPALIIMEDLDLISGTRSMFGNENMLGEMLNQLDGLKKNDAIVIVASTNRVEELDEALNDRPERFDRIFEVGRPTADLAQKIAAAYLNKCGISEDAVKNLNLQRYFKDGEFTGAQIVEVVKGAIFESVHRGCDVNEMCLKASKEGLEKQRQLIIKKQKRD